MAELASTYAALILADEGLEITADKLNTLMAAAKTVRLRLKLIIGFQLPATSTTTEIYNG